MPIRPIHLLWLSLFVLAGCQNQGRKLISGHWIMETPDEIRQQTTQLDERVRDRAADNQEEIYNGVADGEIVGRMSLVFHKSGDLETFTDLPKARSHKKGKWVLLSYDADTSKAVIRCDLQQQQTETEVEFLSQDRIKLVPPNIAVLGKELVFRRE